MPVRDIAKIKKDGKSHLFQVRLENKILRDYWDFQSKNLWEKLKQTGKKDKKRKSWLFRPTLVLPGHFSTIQKPGTLVPTI